MRRLFIRVKDPGTGHEFDVHEDSILLRRGLVQRVKPRLYPPSAAPRPTKHHITLSGRRGPQRPKEQ